MKKNENCERQKIGFSKSEEENARARDRVCEWGERVAYVLEHTDPCIFILFP